ncbi:hypothetical protein MERGE_002747 [Pneumocystis wakefieldiae]|uniref:Uncharacterized protein n=1 Tax=Pneumocystis wakefieldiae TaxID=38082 RepID=A0A899FY72_9ASCO|nr:hypothetical protein MERGE_002747 [Pneumocystis wakefieldiae]
MHVQLKIFATLSINPYSNNSNKTSTEVLDQIAILNARKQLTANCSYNTLNYCTYIKIKSPKNTKIQGIRKKRIIVYI